MEFLISSLLSLVGVYDTLDRRLRPAPDVVKDLRTIRFNENGLLPILESIARGEKRQPHEFAEAVSTFREADFRVGLACENLFNDLPELSRKMRSDLASVASAKSSVRREALQSCFGKNGMVRISPSDAAVLVTKIHSLNSAIDGLEHILLHGRAN